jgi:beta-galactosidase
MRWRPLYEHYRPFRCGIWFLARGRFRRNAEKETIRLPQPVKARYLKFVALSEQSGQPFATIAELEVEEAR